MAQQVPTMNASRRWTAVLTLTLGAGTAWCAEPAAAASAPHAAKAAQAPHKAGPAARPLPAAAAPTAPGAGPGATARAALPFAQVGDTVITGADYQRALAVAMRKKYYHAKPPEAEYAKFQREVGDDVVNRVLLLAEARRRGVQPDGEQIKATVAGYDAQYKTSPNWASNRSQMLAAVVPQLERESVLERFERQIKQVPEPDEAVARAFYGRNSGLFIEPEQVKLRVIVLRVDPSSPQTLWDSAKVEIQRIHKKLLAQRPLGSTGRRDGLHAPRHAARGRARCRRQAHRRGHGRAGATARRLGHPEARRPPAFAATQLRAGA